MGIVQAAMIGIVGVILILQLKNGKSEYGIYLTIAVSLLLFFGMSEKLSSISETIRTIGNVVNVEELYVKTMMKMLGIVYVTEFAAGICKDAGYQTIAGQIEIFAKLTLLGLSMPVLEALIQAVGRFLGQG